MHKHVILEEIGAEFFNRECVVSHFYDKRVCDHPVPQVVVLMTQLMGQCHTYVPSAYLSPWKRFVKASPALTWLASSPFACSHWVKLSHLAASCMPNGVLSVFHSSASNAAPGRSIFSSTSAFVPFSRMSTPASGSCAASSYARRTARRKCVMISGWLLIVLSLVTSTNS